MDILPKLFGSTARVKLMRLFTFNPDSAFSLVEISKKSKVNAAQARKELSLLEGVGMIKVRKLQKESSRRKHWFLNQDFFFIENLRSLFNAEFLASREDLLKRFKGCGKLKLVILSGLFVQDGAGRADILVVGDDLKRKPIEKAMAQLEAEIGRDILYALLDTQDFHYRLHSSDKFLRDILDYPHQRILDKVL